MQKVWRKRQIWENYLWSGKKVERSSNNFLENLLNYWEKCSRGRKKRRKVRNHEKVEKIVSKVENSCQKSLKVQKSWEKRYTG